MNEAKLQKVYVNACPSGGYVAIVSEEARRKWLFESLPDYLRKKGATLEAEYFAIITALRNIDGDMTIFSDSESIVRTLNKKNKIGKKHGPQVETVRQLSQNRHVHFKPIKGKDNKADLSSHIKLILQESVRP